MAEIVFLGTGGGRVNLVKQFRWTGGFRINSKSANIHIDPGPGAVVHSKELNQDLTKLDAVIVTHFHIDHFCDAPVLIEAMSGYALKSKGILIGSSSFLNLDGKNDQVISKYHLSKPKEICSAEPGKRQTFATKKGQFEVEFIKTKHDDPTGFGFKLYIDGVIIGYTSDTEFFSGIGELYKGCDYLIVNSLKPDEDGIPDHMKTSDIIALLKVAKPKVAILTHMGMNFIRAGPESEARKIQEASGVRCVAAKDGQVFRVSLDQF